MHELFISYSRRDIDFVRKLAADLEKAGYDVWWDIADIRGGDDWVRVIPAAIKSSRYVLVVLSPNSMESEWVEKEYTQALSLRKKIIPIMLATIKMPFALNTVNYVNFAAGDYFDNLKNLLSTLEYTGELPIPPSASKWIFSGPNALKRYSIPVLLGMVVLLTFMRVSGLAPTNTPTPTISAIPSITPFPTFTPTTVFTPTATLTLTPTITLTPTQKATSPPLPTKPTLPTFETLTYCVNSPYAYSINVRSGPGTNYAPFGEPLSVGKCLAFSARNEEETWLQIAPKQSEVELEQYLNGWIFRELLGLGSVGPIDLPAVTLTPTPIPSVTSTMTASFTVTPVHTPTPTDTSLPTDTLTP